MLNACLAVSAKQLSLLDPGAAGGVEPSVAMHYYKNALEMMRISIEDDDYVQSDELFGASVILSTYVIGVMNASSSASHSARRS